MVDCLYGKTNVLKVPSVIRLDRPRLTAEADSVMAESGMMGFVEVEMIFGDVFYPTMYIGLAPGSRESFITEYKVTDLKLWEYVTDRERYQKWNHQYTRTTHRTQPKDRETATNEGASRSRVAWFRHVHKSLVQILPLHQNIDELVLSDLSIGPVSRVGTLNGKYRYKTHQDPINKANVRPWRNISFPVVRAPRTQYDWYMGENLRS